LVKRGLANRAVYDLTLDYDFKPLNGRASSVLLRIDYSDVEGYWDQVICESFDPNPSPRLRFISVPPGDLNTARKRSVEVQQEHGGSYKRWIDHTWRKERRETPDHKLHELHARWFSLDPDEWYEKFRDVDNDFAGARRNVNVSSTFSGRRKFC
jgi:chitinase